MNTRLELVAKTLLSLALSADESGTGAKVKTLAEYRSDAAVILATLDMLFLSTENIADAATNAGCDLDSLEQFFKITKELNQLEEPARFFISDMEKAWARGHEDGFWDARQTDATKPEPVTPTSNRTFFNEADIENAEAQGYVSGWHNGILSGSTLPSDSSEKLLLGAEHGKAANPYSDQQTDNKAVREGKEGHAMWCAGDHEGDCKRGQVTGTEKGNDDE